MPLKAVSPSIFEKQASTFIPGLVSPQNTLPHIYTPSFQEFLTPPVSFASDIHLPGFANCVFSFLTFRVASKMFPWRYDMIGKASRTSQSSEDNKGLEKKDMVG